MTLHPTDAVRRERIDSIRGRLEQVTTGEGWSRLLRPDDIHTLLDELRADAETVERLCGRVHELEDALEALSAECSGQDSRTPRPALQTARRVLFAPSVARDGLRG